MLVLQPPADLVNGLFKQVFKRAMESMNPPAAAGIPLLLLEEYVRAFQCQELQAGMAFAIDGKMQGLDLFDHPATARRMFPKLVRSYALDALETCGATAAAPSGLLAEFLAGLAEAQSFVQPAMSLGKDVRVSGSAVSGAALWAGRYVHICAFARQAGAGGSFSTRMARPAARRDSVS